MQEGSSNGVLSSYSSRISFEADDWDRRHANFPSHCSATSTPGLSRAGGIPHPTDSQFSAWRELYPDALTHFSSVLEAISGKLVAIFLDYDGTLTPIVSNPDAAFLCESTREVIRRIAALFPTAIISGRGREKVQQFVQLDHLFYAGSHGMDIAGPSPSPGVQPFIFQPAAQFKELMNTVFEDLERGVSDIEGAAVEHNTFCVSVHFRNCDPKDYPRVVSTTEGVIKNIGNDNIRISRGRKVLEVRPRVNWNKGAALEHLLKVLGLHDPNRVFAVYIGDDRTDEDAFQVLREKNLGGGVLVSTKIKETSCRWTLRDPDAVASFLNELVRWGETGENAWHRYGVCNGWGLSADDSNTGSGSNGAHVDS